MMEAAITMTPRQIAAVLLPLAAAKAPAGSEANLLGNDDGDSLCGSGLLEGDVVKDVASNLLVVVGASTSWSPRL